MQKIDIKGHSGCEIDVIDIDNKLYIRKSTKDPKYLNRLLLQGNKQLNDSNGQNIVSVPKIYEIANNDDETYILMDYIYARNFIDYFEHASKLDIDNFIETFEKYIDNELSKCTITRVSKNVFIDKFNSIVSNCSKNPLCNTEIVNNILDTCNIFFTHNMPDEIEIPINVCHGDLTFSNILFTSKDFYFIDYLDSFIETPIQDIVKIRQDTKYFWSTQMYSKQYDEIRLKMIFRYIDKKIDTYFTESEESYSKVYNILQVMNILRILPYVKEEKVRDFVLNILDELLSCKITH